jgi:hypothetical protein
MDLMKEFIYKRQCDGRSEALVLFKQAISKFSFYVIMRLLRKPFWIPSLIPRNEVVALILVLFFLASHASIYTVKQDGSGNFTTIQAGINAAASGDTVLVWPGTYFENIDYDSKCITVASLYLTTQNNNYIHSTIIDGNNNGSCVAIINCAEMNTILCGFTIQHGSGDFIYNTGGGINIWYSNVILSNNRIHNNQAEYGGGIDCRDSNVELTGNTICFNKAYSSGGGIDCSFGSEIVFNPNIKNNIYMNYSAFGNDFIKSSETGAMDFIVDTFTVEEPDEHFIYSADLYANPQYDIMIQIDHFFLEQVNANLFINPNGNDTNSGLTADLPLKTISFALQKIKADSAEPKTIFLQQGTYSANSNGEFLPINPRCYIIIQGISTENTIIDGQNEAYHLNSNPSIKHLVIKKISFINGFGNKNNFPGWGGLLINKNKNLILDSIEIFSSEGAYGTLTIYDPFDAYLNDVKIHSNKGGINIGSGVTEQINFIIKNSVIEDIIPAFDINYGTGGGMIINGTQLGPANLHGRLINILFIDNICHPDPFWGDGGGSGITIANPCLIDIINCSFGNNQVIQLDGGTIYTLDGPDMTVYNTVLHNNNPRNFYLDQSNNSNFQAIVNIIYSDVEGGEEEIFNNDNYNIVNWLNGNIDEDPLWEEGEPFSYALESGSPCIDAGVPMYEAGMEYPYIKEEEGKYVLYMLDGDTVTLPATDLAGNPRISGGRIDMGAYEWQDTGTGSKNIKYQSQKLKVSVYPNPFSSNVFISFSTEKEYLIDLKVVDMSGMGIRTIASTRFPAGDYRLVWDGKDEDGFVVKAGSYVVCLYLDSRLAGFNKMLRK